MGGEEGLNWVPLAGKEGLLRLFQLKVGFGAGIIQLGGKRILGLGRRGLLGGSFFEFGPKEGLTGETSGGAFNIGVVELNWDRFWG